MLGARDTSQGVPHYGVLGARVASPGVPHCGVLGARVVCPELDILGQNIRGTTNIQGLNVGEALISHKYGIGGVTGEHKLNETRRHNILTTVMAPISANSETLGEFSEDVRAYSETQGLLVGIACLEGMEMEVHTPPSREKNGSAPYMHDHDVSWYASSGGAFGFSQDVDASQEPQAPRRQPMERDEPPKRVRPTPIQVEEDGCAVARIKMIRGLLAPTNNPPTDGQVVPFVDLGPPSSQGMELGDENFEELHENIVQVADPDFVTQGAGIVLETIAPVVDGISVQVTSLGEQVNILGRVGQTAENCFHLFEQRLADLQQEHKNLQTRCETAFPQVREELDTKELKYRILLQEMKQKCDGVSLHLGEFEAEWEGKIEALIGNAHNNSLHQEKNNRQMQEILAEIGAMRESQNWHMEPLEAKIAQLQENGLRIDGRLEEQKALVGEWSKWVVKEVTRLEAIVQEARDTPLLNILAVVQPQLEAAKKSMADLRSDLDTALAGIRLEINEFHREGEKKFQQAETWVNQIRESSPAIRIADWAPKLEALSHSVEEIRAWVGAKEAEGQIRDKLANDKELALSKAITRVEELGRAMTMTRETPKEVPSVPLVPPATGVKNAEGRAAPVGQEAQRAQVQAASATQIGMHASSSSTTTTSHMQKLPALFPQGPILEQDNELKTLIDMAARLGLSVVRLDGGPSILDNARTPLPRKKMWGKVATRGWSGPQCTRKS